MDFRLTPRTPRIPCPGCRPEILRRVQGFKKKAQNHTPGNKAPPVWPCFLPAVKTAPVWRGSKVIRNRGHPAAQPHSTERRRGAAGSRRGNRRAAKENTQRDPRSQYNGRMDKGQPAQAHHEEASCCVLSFIPFHGQRRTPQPRSVRLCVGERGATPSPATA